MIFKYVCSTKPKQEKTEFVIPLIKTNNWKTQKAGKDGDRRDDLDTQAMEEIMQGTWRNISQTCLNNKIKK